jgi:hypothetical protein
MNQAVEQQILDASNRVGFRPTENILAVTIRRHVPDLKNPGGSTFTLSR